MAIIVFQHSELCRPGRLGLTLRDHAFKLDIRRLDKGDRVPTDFDDVDGVVSLGGPQNVGGPEKWLDAEIHFLKEAHDRSLPVIGVCLGHQLIGKALGADVGPMNTPEVGMVPVDITPAGQTDTILAGVAWRSRQFQVHSYEVKDTPPGSALLASSKGCKVQCFRAGLRTYGFQYHLEADRQMITALVKDSREACVQGGVTIDEALKQADEHYEMFARLSDRVCLNIATCLVPRVANMIR